VNAHEGGSLLVVVGVLILFVAIFFPRFLPFIPGNRWIRKTNLKGDSGCFHKSTNYPNIT